MEFTRINTTNTQLLQSFIDRAGRSLETFRYFANRPFSVIENHLCTWVFVDNNHVEAYGHLDKEGDTVWLGIAVAEPARGKGFGGLMMGRLMESAKSLGLRKVKLSVDHVNLPAIKLYERYGFILVERKETFGFYEWYAKPLKQAVMSSLAFMGQPAEEVISTAKQNGLILEFSSGMPYRPDMEKLFLDAPVTRFAHNYFPAPKEPFVLNLGSSDESIRKHSVLHCINGIGLSYAAGAPFFSAHAGFCIDPKPAELGKQLSRVESFDREKHWTIFIRSVKEVLKATESLPTGFLLENNVLAKMNVYADGSNPLLCVEAEEMLRLLEEVSDPRAGILLDTAHLKVSSVTLGFNLGAAAKKVLPVSRCIHHSDNDGLQDNNKPFGKDYWFLPFMKDAAHAVHVLEVRKQAVEELWEMEKVLFS